MCSAEHDNCLEVRYRKNVADIIFCFTWILLLVLRHGIWFISSNVVVNPTHSRINHTCNGDLFKCSKVGISFNCSKENSRFWHLSQSFLGIFHGPRNVLNSIIFLTDTSSTTEHKYHMYLTMCVCVWLNDF